MKSYLTLISTFILLALSAVPAAFSAPPQEPLKVIVQGDGVITSDPAGIICPSDRTALKVIRWVQISPLQPQQTLMVAS